jgi:hypothetical protein
MFQKKISLSLFLLIGCISVFAQKTKLSDNGRLDISIGLANPKAEATFGQFYKSKGIQPRLTIEYGLIGLPYSKQLHARIAAIAGLEPGSFTNKTTMLTEAKMTNKPLGGRFYPLALRNGLDAVKWKRVGYFVDEALLGALWLLNGFYLEAGTSPGVTIKEEGYADVSRSPSFNGWGIALYDFAPENKLRFKFNFGTRKYKWTNASNTSSEIKSFCVDFGLSYRF